MVEYQVRHSKAMDAETARFTGDAARCYGTEFANVWTRRPTAFLAEGSAVTVFKGEVLS